jgi:hypothetical protein
MSKERWSSKVGRISLKAIPDPLEVLYPVDLSSLGFVDISAFGFDSDPGIYGMVQFQ